ncbi:MAG: glycosyl hydrolase, partial [bacterium]
MSSYIARTLATAFVGFLCARTTLAVESASVKALFANPPRQYSSGPLWVWNDMLTEEQIRSTLRDLAGQKVKQAFVHPRPGLMTPYLSEDWFRLWKVALDEAERLDMNIWIYDENSYPSGFAGGLLPEAMPRSRGRGLVFRDETRPQWDGETALVYRLTGDGYENITEQARYRKSLPEGRYLVARWELAKPSGWFAGKYYVDLLKPGVTEKFIEITFDAYQRQVGDQFGDRVPGIFTDEPHLWAEEGVHWNEHLCEEFRKRWHYDMEDQFPALVHSMGDWRRVRHNYQQLLLEQFVEHWGKPCYEWCERHGLEFTGHYWEHGWPDASHGPDNMAMYAWHQRPAIDNLMNVYTEDVHGQFGNSRTVKELSSVANQLDRKRTLCEAYGA